MNGGWRHNAERSLQSTVDGVRHFAVQSAVGFGGAGRAWLDVVSSGAELAAPLHLPGRLERGAAGRVPRVREQVVAHFGYRVDNLTILTGEGPWQRVWCSGLLGEKLCAWDICVCTYLCVYF